LHLPQTPDIFPACAAAPCSEPSSSPSAS
jgi:hypothetical protein